MSTTMSRGGFAEGVENLDLTAPVGDGSCCGGGNVGEGCCGEPAQDSTSVAAGGCCGEPAAATISPAPTGRGGG